MSANQFRSLLFRYLDGMVTAPSAFALHKHGVLAWLLEHQSADSVTIAEVFEANEGYLNVALRVLTSQGWLDTELKDNIPTYCLNSRSEEAFGLIQNYARVVELMQLSGNYHPRRFEKVPFEFWYTCTQQYLALNETDMHLSEIGKQVLHHIEGVLVAPSFVHLGMTGMFHQYFMEASFRPDEFHKEPEAFARMLDFFSTLGFFSKNGETYRFTDKGMFFAKRASAFGVTVSYLPTLRSLDELIFGNALCLQSEPMQPEKHVDREMNVWGSGGAHASYFNKVDEVIVELFNRPIHEQPRGVLDMGCGNGAFLIHLYEVIAHRTSRGRMLDEHPLYLIGADYNQAALKVTRQNLIQADIWAKVIWGDIGQPDLLAADLKENYDLDLTQILNVRTFLDHNRMWEPPTELLSMAEPGSTGAYAYKGKRLTCSAVEASLAEHLKKWQPWIQRFGLLLIELHTVHPSLVSKHLGRTAATAYDATHGYSDQYILELEVFLKIAKSVGMTAQPQYASRFPDSDLATVSVNLFK